MENDQPVIKAVPTASDFIENHAGNSTPETSDDTEKTAA
jgi:hypothetical protein